MTTANPVMVIGAIEEPATPYEWAQGLHALLTNSVFVSLTFEGHTGQGKGNKYVDNLVKNFIYLG